MGRVGRRWVRRDCVRRAAEAAGDVPRSRSAARSCDAKATGVDGRCVSGRPSGGDFRSTCATRRRGRDRCRTRCAGTAIVPRCCGTSPAGARVCAFPASTPLVERRAAGRNVARTHGLTRYASNGMSPIGATRTAARRRRTTSSTRTKDYRGEVGAVIAAGRAVLGPVRGRCSTSAAAPARTSRTSRSPSGTSVAEGIEPSAAHDRGGDDRPFPGIPFHPGDMRTFAPRRPLRRGDEPVQRDRVHDHGRRPPPRRPQHGAHSPTAACSSSRGGSSPTSGTWSRASCAQPSSATTLAAARVDASAGATATSARSTCTTCSRRSTASSTSKRCTAWGCSAPHAVPRRVRSRRVCATQRVEGLTGATWASHVGDQPRRSVTISQGSSGTDSGERRDRLTDEVDDLARRAGPPSHLDARRRWAPVDRLNTRIDERIRVSASRSTADTCGAVDGQRLTGRWAAPRRARRHRARARAARGSRRPRRRAAPSCQSPRWGSTAYSSARWPLELRALERIERPGRVGAQRELRAREVAGRAQQREREPPIPSSTTSYSRSPSCSSARPPAVRSGAVDEPARHERGEPGLVGAALGGEARGARPRTRTRRRNRRRARGAGSGRAAGGRARGGRARRARGGTARRCAARAWCARSTATVSSLRRAHERSSPIACVGNR